MFHADGPKEEYGIPITTTTRGRRRRRRLSMPLILKVCHTTDAST